MPRKYEMVRLAEHEGDHWRVVPADLVESFLGSEVSYEHVTAVDLRDVEPLTRALAEILGSCQEVAHRVEDPTQGCAEIEAAARKALKAFEEDSDAA